MGKLASTLFSLNSKDLSKGAVVAVLVVALGMLQQMVSAHGLDIGAYDWSGIMKAAGEALVAYLGKNFMSDSDGKVLGTVG